MAVTKRTISVSLPMKMIEKIDQEAEQTGFGRSVVILMKLNKAFESEDNDGSRDSQSETPSAE